MAEMQEKITALEGELKSENAVLIQAKMELLKVRRVIAMNEADKEKNRHHSFTHHHDRGWSSPFGSGKKDTATSHARGTSPRTRARLLKDSSPMRRNLSNFPI